MGAIQKNKRKSILRIILGILLALPVGYLLFKSNLPGQSYSEIDAILKYCIPVFIALAYIIDSWDIGGRNTTSRIIKGALIIIPALIFGVVMGQGEALNENDILGPIAASLFLFSISCIFFYCGSFQYRKELLKDRKLRAAYYISIGSLVLSSFQLPLWIIISGQFPPKGFTDFQAIILTMCAIIALFGPAAPWLIMLRRYLVGMNELKRIKKEKDNNSFDV